MKRFLCDYCNKFHEFYEKIEVLEPDILYDMNAKERSKRVNVVNFIFLIDKSLALSKGRFHVEVLKENLTMEWEVWVELDNIRDYIKMTENLDNKSVEYLSGILYTGIPLFEKDKGVNVRLKYELNGPILPPLVEILDEKTKIGKAFNNGITSKEVKSWIEKVHHSKKVL